MATTLKTNFEKFMNKSTGKMTELYAKTSAIREYTGVPRYAKNSGGGLIPSSGAISLDAEFSNPKWDQAAPAFKETRNGYNIASGYVLPNTSSDGANYWGGTSSTNGAWRRYSWTGRDGGSYWVEVSGYWAGGVQDIYGNWTTQATFRYFTIRFSHSSTVYGIINSYNHTSRGHSNNNGYTSQTNLTPSSSSGDKNVTIVCKSRA